MPSPDASSVAELRNKMVVVLLLCSAPACAICAQKVRLIDDLIEAARKEALAIDPNQLVLGADPSRKCWAFEEHGAPLPAPVVPPNFTRGTFAPRGVFDGPIISRELGGIRSGE